MTDQQPIFTLNNQSDLENCFRYKHHKVGPRTGKNRRTQDQKEYYNLRQYLRALGANGALHYPLTVSKSERPDFMLLDPVNGCYGLEVTEATTKDYQRELTISEQQPEQLIPLGRDGWVGDSAEREVCAAILRAIRRKVGKLRKGNYKPTARIDLLIYVSVRAFFYEEEQVQRILLPRIERWSRNWFQGTKLGRISVIMAQVLFHDITDHQSWLPLCKEEDVGMDLASRLAAFRREQFDQLRKNDSRAWMIVAALILFLFALHLLDDWGYLSIGYEEGYPLE